MTISKKHSPKEKTFKGKYVILIPINPQTQINDLFELSHNIPEKNKLFEHLNFGPFDNIDQMKKWLIEKKKINDEIVFSVFSIKLKKFVGMLSLINISAKNKRLEIASIWYAPIAQKTEVNTESVYLLLKYAFDELNYRRVEWKCDNKNKKSYNAAIRLGFKFEGIFRQHMIFKGKNRDTAWFSIIDKEWPNVQKNIRTWLYSKDNRTSLTKLNK